jgi:hypothetical protein
MARQHNDASGTTNERATQRVSVATQTSVHMEAHWAHAERVNKLLRAQAGAIREEVQTMTSTAEVDNQMPPTILSCGATPARMACPIQLRPTEQDAESEIASREHASSPPPLDSAPKLHTRVPPRFRVRPREEVVWMA